MISRQARTLITLTPALLPALLRSLPIPVVDMIRSLKMIDRDKINQLAVRNKPATLQDISRAEKEIGYSFPLSLVELLSCSNGLLVEDDLSLRLYSTEEIAERNATYEVATYAPTMLCIGDDGGGRAILLERESGTVYLVDMGSLVKEDVIFLAESITEWSQNGFALKEEETVLIVDVYLIGVPEGGARELLRLKKELNLPLSAVELHKGLKELPFCLLRSVPYQKYAPLSDRYKKIIELIPRPLKL